MNSQTKNILSCAKLYKSYNGNEVIRGVDLCVRPGEITLLIGPSGGGKTTLLKCLAFLEQADSGMICFDGEKINYPLTNHNESFRPWPKLTVVFQQHFLWPHLTIRQNILLPLGKDIKKNNARFEELVTLFEMESFVDRHPNEVSIGQQQRAALARALVLNPKYILMDEITSALDVEQIMKIFRHLLDLKARGIGILLVTHLLDMAYAILKKEDGDKIVFLENGRVLQAGGINVLECPEHPRVQEFVSMMNFSD